MNGKRRKSERVEQKAYPLHDLCLSEVWVWLAYEGEGL